MSVKKAFALRYPEEIQDAIEEIANLTNYGMSRNKGIVFAIKLTHNIIKRSKKLKGVNSNSEVISHIEKKYDIRYQQWW